MGNLALCWPNRINGDTVFADGSWETALPASNVATRAIQQVARSTGVLTTDTLMNLDFGAATTFRAISLVNHNLSPDAQWKVSLGTTSGGTDVYAGSLADVILATYETSFTALGVENGDTLRTPFQAMLVLDQAYSARYLKLEIDDTTNPDGYVQIGRMFAGGAYVPTINASYGLKDGIQDLSETFRTDGGTFWFNPKRRLRYVSMVLEHLGLTGEAVTLHEMMRTMGRIDEVLYVPDIDDMAYSQRFGFLGVMRELSTLEYPFYNKRSLAVALEEI